MKNRKSILLDVAEAVPRNSLPVALAEEYKPLLKQLLLFTAPGGVVGGHPHGRRAGPRFLAQNYKGWVRANGNIGGGTFVLISFLFVLLVF
jgi:hypothetical protein